MNRISLKKTSYNDRGSESNLAVKCFSPIFFFQVMKVFMAR